jgi:opacity protein-like surface antigen
MNFRKNRARAVLGLLALLGCLLAVQAAEVKIKVIVENASIRVKPGMDSSVLEDKLPVGAIYLSPKKEGEWYEVRFRSKLGLQLTGYIHEMYVEVVGEEAEQTGKQPSVLSGAGPARTVEMRAFEIGLHLGSISGSLMDESTSYSDDWSWQKLESVQENGVITHKLAIPFSVGFSVSYYFRENVGIRLSADYLHKQNLTGWRSTFQMDWTWTGGNDTITDGKEWPATGNYSLFPINFNLIYKFPTGGIFVPYLTGGATVFVGKATLETSLGYGNSWLSDDGNIQYIDYFIIPVKVEKDLTTVGFNLGAGLDLLFSPNFGLNIDAAYYSGALVDEDWPVTAGTYQAVIHAGTTLTMDSTLASYIKTSIPKLNFKLTFFRIAGGFKILF